MIPPPNKNDPADVHRYRMDKYRREKARRYRVAWDLNMRAQLLQREYQMTVYRCEVARYVRALKKYNQRVPTPGVPDTSVPPTPPIRPHM